VFEVQALVGKNRLVVRIWGEIDDAEARQVGDAAVKAIERLRPGFDVMSDLTGLAPVTPEGLAQLRRIIEVAQARGVRRVVRVVGRSVDAALQFERISRELGHEAYLAFSLEEAERLLDGGWP
jgi:cytosine/adenosine deaminase-related metal-dependent hydrolase